LCLTFAAACGSRTGLLIPLGAEPREAGRGDDGTDDGGLDASLDADVEDARDALPPLDVRVPPDVATNCLDAGTPYIYVVTEGYELLSFYPPTAQFMTIGKISCPSAPNSNPFSMAVDHTGIAYVLYNDGELFRVSTATASCRTTSFSTGTTGFSPTFGMGYSRDATGGGETLYIASGEAGSTPPTLGAILPDSGYALKVIGPLTPSILSAELTGTGGGDLFAFYAMSGNTPCDNSTGSPLCPDSAIGQIDKATGKVTNQSLLLGHAQGHAWAFAFYGGDFYTFTAPGPSDAATTVVTRYRPSTGTLTTVAKLADKIVGAGVSTCAPAR
jgi:hypothetical protein